MCGFDHPNVLGLVGISLDQSNSPYLLLPYMENGDLKRFLKKKRVGKDSCDMNYPEVRTWCCWIGIFHGLIKCGINFFVKPCLLTTNAILDA